jgi:hypothetical protein
MWFNSTAAPATVIEDESSTNHSFKKGKGKGKRRVNHEPGDLPAYERYTFGGKVFSKYVRIRSLYRFYL